MKISSIKTIDKGIIKKVLYLDTYFFEYTGLLDFLLRKHYYNNNQLFERGGKV